MSIENRSRAWTLPNRQQRSRRATAVPWLGGCEPAPGARHRGPRRQDPRHRCPVPPRPQVPYRGCPVEPPARADVQSPSSSTSSTSAHPAEERNPHQHHPRHEQRQQRCRHGNVRIILLEGHDPHRERLVLVEAGHGVLAQHECDCKDCGRARRPAYSATTPCAASSTNLRPVTARRPPVCAGRWPAGPPKGKCKKKA